ncbi:uncharacterized protein METZ01_LOCUS490243, partial [marine metagenome]
QKQAQDIAEGNIPLQVEPGEQAHAVVEVARTLATTILKAAYKAAFFLGSGR